jgi:F-type H+-transporting ATPase subunit epsilon
VKLEILTPDKTLYSGMIKSVNLPGTKGRFTILHNHAPIISTLEKGQVKIINNEQKTETIDIAGGIVEVKKNSIIVLADLT